MVDHWEYPGPPNDPLSAWRPEKCFTWPSCPAPIVLRVRPVIPFRHGNRVSAVLSPAWVAAAGLAVACLTSGCTAGTGKAAATTPAAATSSVRATGTAGETGTARATSSGDAAGATPSASQKPKQKPSVLVSRIRTADGSKITVAIFRGPVTFVLHNGATDPGALATAKGVKAGPAVGHSERRQLLAAFNGGFKLAAGAGGYEQEGKVISPLLKGYASLIIDRSGRAHIADWGYGAPAKGEQVYSVRQNLGLLVSHGKPTAAAANWVTWGGTVGGLEYVARSAIGQDAAGDLIYVASMSAVPADLAAALVKAGARTGMELDINPNWVQLDVASRPGGPLRAEVPGQWRPAGQFLTGWDRDFFTVLG